MRGHPFERLIIVEIIAKFRRVVFFSFDNSRLQHALFPEIVTQIAAQLWMLGEALHKNLFRAIEHSLGVSKPCFGIDKRSRFMLGFERWIPK